MTVEKRTLIQLSDILAIEFECSHCHTRHSIPLKEMKAINLRCVNCPQHFAEALPVANKEPDQVVLAGFITKLKEIQERNFHAIIRMEVSNLSDKPAQ